MSNADNSDGRTDADSTQADLESARPEPHLVPRPLEPHEVDHLNKFYAALLAEINEREPGRTFSRRAFQRRHRVGFVTVGMLFDRAVADGALEFSQSRRGRATYSTYRIPTTTTTEGPTP